MSEATVSEARGKPLPLPSPPQGKAGAKATVATEATRRGEGMTRGQIFVAFALAIVAGIVASVGLLGVIASGFALSFDALSSVGIAAHMAAGKAWMLPVSIDGAMLVASVHVVVAQRLGRSWAYPMCVVVVGTLISIAGNGLHATGTADQPLHLASGERFAVSSVPALMLALSVHMLVELLKSLTPERPHATHATHATEIAEAAEPVAVPAEPEATPVPLVAEPEAKPEPKAKAEPRRRVAPNAEAIDDLASHRTARHAAALYEAWGNALPTYSRDKAKDLLGVGAPKADEAIKVYKATYLGEVKATEVAQ